MITFNIQQMDKDRIKRFLPYIILGTIAFVILIRIIYYFTIEKRLELVAPNGGEKIIAGRTYSITWKAQKIEKIGIVLIKGGDLKNPQWIAKDIPASKKKYDWNVFVWQEPGEDYKISIFEYPWKERNLIDYSEENFTIIGPKFAACDQLSIEAQWPFVPRDFPNLRKVFITTKRFDGNLGGLDGADEKCQQEAKDKGLTGTWKAFLGNDQISAIERLKLDGIIVEAESAGTLPEGKTCHRLLGKNFQEFFKLLENPVEFNKARLGEDFFNSLRNVWLGRLKKEDKRSCLVVSEYQENINLPYRYSYTVTCQNWTSNRRIIPGYPPAPGSIANFPECYTPDGRRIDAASLAGMTSGYLTKENAITFFTPYAGTNCDSTMKLICIEQ